MRQGHRLVSDEKTRNPIHDEEAQNRGASLPPAIAPGRYRTVQGSAMCAATAAGGCITFSYLAWERSLRGMCNGQ